MRALLAGGAHRCRPRLERAQAGSTAGSTARARSAASASAFSRLRLRRPRRPSLRRRGLRPLSCGPETCASTERRRAAKLAAIKRARSETGGETGGSHSSGTDRSE